MKLLGILENVLPKKPEARREIYLTCVFHAASVDVAAWEMGTKNHPKVLATATRNGAIDTWEQREIACQGAIGELGQVLGGEESTKVVLGMPVVYLTPDGDIEPDIRKNLSKLLKDLALTPLGFVPTHQALIHSLKEEEGIPPNVILLELGKTSTQLYLYKIGQLTGEKTLDPQMSLVDAVEKGLTEFTEVEVLPSRMLLYGGDKVKLETSQSDLLKHPWQTRANFLHFPKIEVYTSDLILQSVSFAGASELVNAGTKAVAEAEEPALSKTGESAADTDIGEPEKLPVKSPGEAKEETLQETGDLTLEEAANVEMVEPDELGFAANRDVLEEPELPHPPQKTDTTKPDHKIEARSVRRSSKVPALRFAIPKLPTISIPAIGSIASVFPKIFYAKTALLVPLALIVLAGFFGLLYWFVPSAAVTVYLVPKKIAETQDITIDPQSEAVNPETRTVPGKKLEKSLTGEKTIPVTGKKLVGDPARGTATIYNLSFTTRIFKKGTVLTAGSIQYTLDSDVAVASASVNLASGGSTFGKASTTITATSIGEKGNQPANTEFAVKDVSTSIAVARNDQAITGGTSREASVVTRADQDALVKVLTEELAERVKAELTGGLRLGETLIDETVKTTLIDKKFIQELNEEAGELQGSITIAATGVSYVTGDVLSFLKNLVTQQVPAGFTTLEDQTAIDIGSVGIARDGKITTVASVNALAAPQFDNAKIQSVAAGKTMNELESYLKQMSGVGGISVTFRYSPFSRRLPANRSNISVTFAVQK